MMNSSGTKQAAPQTLRLIRCAIKGEEYCVEMAAIHSIGRPHQLGFQTSLAGFDLPTGAKGWITTQQNKFPVFDLAEQLHLPDAGTPQDVHEGFILFVNAAEPFGLRVERIVSNLEVTPWQIVALPQIIEPGTAKRFKGIVKLDDKWLLFADADKLHRLHAGHLSRSNQTARVTTSLPVTAQVQRNSAAQIMLFSPAKMLEETIEMPPMVFGLSLTQVQEISHLLPIISVPGAPNYVYGITNWRDVPIPIIDLQTRLGLSQQPVSAQQIDPKSRLLIARAPTGWLGVPINPQVKAFPLPIPYQRNQQPLSLEQDLVLGVFDLEGSPLVIPDLDAMLTRNFAPQ